ncbi:FAD-dependent oxidoreductase [Actinoallomurus bryophytorum]|uniref:FAD/FMN-containing dehydrogenase n=1 Tax=Actinoallomurus bryophytorum TaxID=1490222 RepID=A0A543CU96_9ACTN|nr:FAD-binding oxidoreductase [Actinoallomurus bryophytorum]TQM00684.1 FAD/FMN-containing dehydrogenase [Actinoallomurus bryophytorum]
MTSTDAAAEAIRELSGRLDPNRVVTSGPAYEATCRIWNGAVASRPAVVVRCRTQADVQAAVRASRNHDLPLSVRAGGHDWAGRSLRDNGLVIDLTGMRQVTVDAEARVATVGGGATATDVVAAGAVHGLAAVTGNVGSVGMAGLTLGGGYGPLSGRFGLAADNLLGAELVLADGRLVTVDEDHEPELFWALRGGGGNFGVVTSMRLRLHALDRLLGGLIVYPWEQATKVLEQADQILAVAPDELTVQVGVLTNRDGRRAVFVTPTWSGEPAAGEAYVDELQRLGDPVMAVMGPMAYGELLRLNDFLGEITGNHYAARTRTMARLTSDVIAVLTEAGDAFTTPLSLIPIHHFHGAATRIPVENTAFGVREDHHMAEIVAIWEPGDGLPHKAWADSVADALAPHSLPGGYPNMLGPDDHAQNAEAYGPNTARLLAAKARFDPDGVFSATALPPSTTGTTERSPRRSG